MIGIYNAKTGELLERCEPRQLDAARAAWVALGYETTVGPAFPEMILLYEK